MLHNHVHDLVLAACPPGTYKDFTGPGDVTVCTKCPDPHHVSPAGSTSISQCTCAEGYKNERRRIQDGDDGGDELLFCAGELQAADVRRAVELSQLPPRVRLVRASRPTQNTGLHRRLPRYAIGKWQHADDMITPNCISST